MTWIAGLFVDLQVTFVFYVEYEEDEGCHYAHQADQGHTDSQSPVLVQSHIVGLWPGNRWLGGWKSFQNLRVKLFTANVFHETLIAKNLISQYLYYDKNKHKLICMLQY